MAYNGDSTMAKRLKTDGNGDPNNHSESFNSINEPKRKRAEIIEKPNHVLLFTVINPAYPITVDVIHTICTPIGQVLRIVIFKKNGVQAMTTCEQLWQVQDCNNTVDQEDERVPIAKHAQLIQTLGSH
ncbi:hypothetical protein LSTR_LSTR010832 [Laodelphax striatellus]|uniref:PTBP1-like RNA recognition motif 2 domain-containing protein n=1 Tax=Laodelphax striatellus TaxID=195883 RepID=A0A482WMB4_LAOST|nr:hypothetical protein LSTR_LSTR010832 [Laodelphax striatellus]